MVEETLQGVPTMLPPSSVSTAIDNYIWDLAQHQTLIDDLEKNLQVVCLFHPEREILYLIDDYYHLPVAIKKITNNPREDIQELAYLWFSLIQLARGRYATITA